MSKNNGSEFDLFTYSERPIHHSTNKTKRPVPFQHQRMKIQFLIFYLVFGNDAFECGVPSRRLKRSRTVRPYSTYGKHGKCKRHCGDSTRIQQRTTFVANPVVDGNLPWIVTIMAENRQCSGVLIDLEVRF